MFTFIEGTVEFIEEKAIEEGKLLTILPKLGKSYLVSFEVKPNRYESAWMNVIWFTATDKDDHGSPGDRTPAVSFYPWFNQSSTTEPLDRLVVSVEVEWQDEFTGLHGVFECLDVGAAVDNFVKEGRDLDRIESCIHGVPELRGVCRSRDQSLLLREVFDDGERA